jgi:hypothetical protein
MLPAVAPAPRKGPKYKPFVPGPNPELPGFIAKHSTPYDPATDRYDVPAFDRDLVVDKAHPPKAIYDMHTYWSKKHWAAIQEYIQHYLPEKFYPTGTGTVLDCFSGSGMTGVAAMMENRPCVLIDASPAAAFISHCYTQPVAAEDLQATHDRMLTEPYPQELQKRLRRITGEEIRNLQQELDWLYATRCDRCGGPATTDYVVYSERFQCPYCNEKVSLYDCPEFKTPKKARYCPNCLAKNHGQPSKDFAISTRKTRFGPDVVQVAYRCLGKCKPPREFRNHHEDARTRKGKYFTEQDLDKLAVIEGAEIPHWYPRRKMMDVEDDTKPWGVKWRKGTSNFRTVAELFTKRNLWALAAIRTAIARERLNSPCAEVWLLAMTAVSLNGSKMYQYRPSLKGGFAKGTYYVPQMSQIMRVSSQFADKRGDTLKFGHALSSLLRGPRVLTNQSAACVSYPAGSLDYIFTDPAYVGKVQYGELNFVWESWLGFDGAWLSKEIIVNPFRNKTLDDWDRDLRSALANCFQGLKPGRWLSLCYHDTDPGTWSRMQDILLDTGFEIHTVTVLDPKQKSSNQITAEKVVKSDLVLNCRKPRPGERRNGDVEAELVSRRVREILIETLGKSGGQTRDKLWDVVLKRLLTRGQMAEHRFDDVLAEVAVRSESGHWFLKEEFESLSQNDIRNEEDAGAALERFARLRAMGTPAQFAAHIALKMPRLAGPEAEESEIERAIRSQFVDDLEAARKFRLGAVLRGIEFYDCLFFYLTRFLKGRPDGKTPRRNLAEFLEEYLVRFKDGDKWLYRPPDRAEAESLKHSRQTGLGRRIRQYVAFLKGEGDFPAEKRPAAKTLVAWLKHCSAFGLADEGVLLFEKGGLAGMTHGLTEDERYDAAEYYGSCRRKASRAAAVEEDEGEDESKEVDEQ